MQPTIGRIVHYRLSEQDVSAITRGEDPIAARSRRNPVHVGQILPALVVATFGGPAVNLKVFLDGAGDHWATSRVEGDQPGEWSWPARA